MSNYFLQFAVINHFYNLLCWFPRNPETYVYLFNRSPVCTILQSLALLLANRFSRPLDIFWNILFEKKGEWISVVVNQIIYTHTQLLHNILIVQKMSVKYKWMCVCLNYERLSISYAAISDSSDCSDRHEPRESRWISSWSLEYQKMMRNKILSDEYFWYVPK